MLKEITKTDVKELLAFGHTMEDHIDIDDKDLLDRLINGKYDGKHYAEKSSTRSTKFSSAEIANKAIFMVLKKNAATIEQWTNLCFERRLVLNTTFLQPIGYGYVKGTSYKTQYQMYRCTVILEADEFYSEVRIVTAYPDTNIATEQQIQRDKQIFFANRRRHY